MRNMHWHCPVSWRRHCIKVEVDRVGYVQAAAIDPKQGAPARRGNPASGDTLEEFGDHVAIDAPNKDRGNGIISFHVRA
jgi:hypothetical protein